MCVETMLKSSLMYWLSCKIKLIKKTLLAVFSIKTTYLENTPIQIMDFIYDTFKYL